MPQLDRLTPKGEPPSSTRLGGPEHIGRDASLDREHAPIEVVETQRHQLAAPCPQVGGQADEKSDLFGLVPAFGRLQIGRNDERLGGVEQTEDLLAAEMEPDPRARADRACRSSVLTSMMRSTCAHPMAERSTRKRPETTATEAPADLHAAMAARTCSGLSVDTRCAASGSARERLDVGARPDPRRRPPVVVGAEPALEQVADA